MPQPKPAQPQTMGEGASSSSRVIPTPPYLSQWGSPLCSSFFYPDHDERVADLFDWTTEGYEDAASYVFWSDNICGLTCLQMIMATYPDRYPQLRKADLIERAVKWKVLIPRKDGKVDGLYYAPFVEWVQNEFAMMAESRPHLEVSEIAELAGSGCAFVIASVSHEIRIPDVQPKKRGGHLVLVYDYDRDADELVFHNPSGIPAAAEYPDVEGLPQVGTAAGARCTPEVFERFFSGRGIVVWREDELFDRLALLLDQLPSMEELGTRVAGARDAKQVVEADETHRGCVHEYESACQGLARARESLEAAMDQGDQVAIDAAQHEVIYFSNEVSLRTAPVENSRIELERVLAASGLASVEAARAAQLPAGELAALERRLASYQREYERTLAACQLFDADDPADAHDDARQENQIGGE